MAASEDVEKPTIAISNDSDGVSDKEARRILQLVASTGKFWQEWDKLKAILSSQLKQVLSEYPEAKITNQQYQTAFLGDRDTFADLNIRLDQALLSFDQGPPFTLQRLCEILLDARSIYPTLSKLALALEKNLLVTSMLSMSTDPSPQQPLEEPKEAVKTKTEQLEVEKEEEEEQKKEEPEGDLESKKLATNGEPITSDKDDEIMAEADVEEDNMTIDIETFHNIVGPSQAATIVEDPPNTS